MEVVPLVFEYWKNSLSLPRGPKVLKRAPWDPRPSKIKVETTFHLLIDSYAKFAAVFEKIT